MSGVALVDPKYLFTVPSTGAPLANGRVQVYVAGSTTPTPTWSDYGLTSLNANPIQLDANGACTIWTDPTVTYKFEVSNAAGAVLYTVDNIKGAEPAGALSTALAASTGAALVGCITTGGVARTVQTVLREIDFSVKTFGATGDGVTDDYTAIQLAINTLAAAGGGRLYFPRGKYRCTSMLTLSYNSGVGIELYGDGGIDQSSDSAVSVIYAAHNQDAVLNMQGAIFCRLSNIAISGGTNLSLYPKTGLILGRNGTGSAGWHTFDKVAVNGFYSVAAVYNVASEGNLWLNCWAFVEGGAATMALYLASSDAGGLNPVTPLTGSSLLGQEFVNCHFYMYSTAAGVSPIVIDGSVVTGSIAFRGGYIVQANGHFVSLRNGNIDGKDTLGPITFDGVGGEAPGGAGTALSGFHITAGSGIALRGLAIRNCEFLMTAGKYILQDSNVTIQNAFIKSCGINYSNTSALTTMAITMGDMKFGRAVTVTGPGQNLNCFVDVGAGQISESTQVATLANGWTSTFSVNNTYGPVGFFKTPDGFVNLVGAPGNGTENTVIFTLPDGYRPGYNQSFLLLSNATAANLVPQTQITISTAGAVTAVGTGIGVNPVYLCGVRFQAI